MEDIVERLYREEEELIGLFLEEEFGVKFFPGEPIWWHDSPRGGYGAFRPAIAVYICKRGSRAGIAVRLTNGSWFPKVVSFSKISSRFE